jgi:hypothetical protein
MTSPYFPTDLTPEEHVAGFRLIDIYDPHSYLPGGQTIKAVIYRAGPSHRVVKRRLSSGEAYYVLEHFSVLEGAADGAPGSWDEVGADIERDPNRAVEKASSMMRDPPGVRRVSRIPSGIERMP